MAAKTPPAKKLTTNNTKQEMLAAYTDLLKQLEEQREFVARPEEKIEQRITAEAVKVADELSTEGVVKQVGELRGTIGRLLAQVSNQLEEQVDRYAQISKAIAFKEKELSDIYEIQRSALSLAALIQAQQQKREQFESEMEQRKEELTREIDETRSAWEQERKQYEAALKERDAAEGKRRKREEEEYRYAFAREQQIARDKFTDETARAEKDLAQRKADAEREFAERERTLAAREQELADLRNKVAGFQAQLDAAVERAAKDAAGRAQADAIAREELLKREFGGERNVFSTRIAALEQTVKEQAEQIKRFSQQADKAYAQVQDIAVKAIEGSSATKSLAGLQQAISDAARRGPAER